MTPIPSGFKLDRLVVLVRHGARTTLSQANVLQPQEWIMSSLINIPDRIEKTSIQVKNLDGTVDNPVSEKEAHYRETVLPGGGILGQLTTIGYEQAYNVGQYLRKTYGEFDTEDFFIRSTNIYRTIETSRGVLAGWKNGTPSNVTIFVEDDDKKEFLYPNGKLPFIGKGTQWIWEAPGLDPNIQILNKQILKTLNIDFESDFSGRNPIYLRDDITARWEHGFTIDSPFFKPDQLNSVMPLIQKSAADLLNLIGRDTPENELKLMPMVSGRLLDFISKLQSRISILGAHDTTVGPMLTALKVSSEINSHWPRYCAHIDFEFLSNDDGAKFVRILYDEKPVVIGGASDSIITLDEFDKLTSWVRMSAEDFEAASGMDDSDWDAQFSSEEIEKYIGGSGAPISLN